MFLQETRLNNSSHGRLNTKWIGEVYHSNFSCKARGAVILLRKGILFLGKKTVADKDGHNIIVTGDIYNISLTLVNIYAPNIDNPIFFQKVFALISDISQTNLITGGELIFGASCC